MYIGSCLQQHLGLWAIEPQYANRLFSLIPSLLAAGYKAEPVVAFSEAGYDIVSGGSAGGAAAVIPIVRHMTKGGDSFGGCSTVRARRAIRQAVRDGHSRVGVFIDSPGGQVAGTQELAEELRRAGEQVETFAHIEDLGASGAYWLASQAHRVTANAASLSGNIGVRSEIHDTSRMAEMEGVKVHLLTTGPFKAIGVPGTEVTPEQIAHEQSIVNDLFGLFVDAISTGRGLTGAQLANVLDGRIFTAEKALDAGLIDEIGSYEDLYHAEGGSQVDEETRAAIQEAVTAALVTAVPEVLAQHGLIQVGQPVNSNEPSPPPVFDTQPDDSKPRQQIYPSAGLPELQAPDTSGAVSIDEAYHNGYLKGRTKARETATSIVKKCLDTAKLTAESKQETIEQFAAAAHAIESGRSLSEYLESAYGNRIEGRDEDINNSPPYQEPVAGQSKEHKRTRSPEEVQAGRLRNIQGGAA